MIKKDTLINAHGGRPDYVLLGASVGLIIIGILALASASATFSQVNFGNTYYFLNHQLLFALIPGLLLGLAGYFVSLDLLKKIAPILLLINLLFLVMVFIPGVGSRFWGATRWVNLGSYVFQPSELLKLSFIIYLATWLEARTRGAGAKKRGEGDPSKTLLAFFVVIGLLSVLLILQPDLSTLGLIIATAGVMYFLADTPLWHIMAIISVGALLIAFFVFFEPYRLDRLRLLLDPSLDPMGKGYQQSQALIAVGSGGVYGLGLGLSRQRYGLLPESMSDAIFTIFTEETGLIGSTVLIVLFLAFAWRGFVASRNSIAEKFPKLLSQGLTFWIIFQAFINISAMIGIFPIAGIPLPFVSYGGSHMITELAAVGLLLNISRKLS